jgi:dipeptidyl aminopeptidase/acylaminoacyl peptidase
LNVVSFAAQGIRNEILIAVKELIMKSFFRSVSPGKVSLFVAFLILFSISAGADQKNLYKEGYLLPPEFVQDILNRSSHYDTLDNLSPDGVHLMIPVNADFSSLELMTQKTYRLAMLEFCPDVNREWRLSTSGTIGVKIFSLEQKKSWMVDLPDGAFISDMTWSPDGKKIAFLTHLPQGSQVWTADVETGRAQPLSKAYVMATLSVRSRFRRGGAASAMLQWTPRGSVVTLLVPAKRGPEPKKSEIPKSPIIRHTREKAASTPTYPFLLRSAYDKELFRYYTTSQLAELIPGKPPRLLGEPAMYLNIALSPDGNYILAEKLNEPFSFIVSYRSFPQELQVMDLEGKTLSTIRKVPLQEAEARRDGRDPTADLPRDVAWRPDGKGLSFLWREQRPKKDKDQDQEEADREEERSERKDRLMLLAPPFDMEQAQTLITSMKRFSQVSYEREGRYVFARLSGRGEDCETGTDIAAFDLKESPPRKIILLGDIETEDPVKLPGDIMTQTTSNGVTYALTSSDGEYVYLEGDGYKEDHRPQPFIDRISILSGEKERVFEGSEDMYENPLVPVDNDLNALIISRESAIVFPDSFLWEKGGSLTKLTDNRNPFPEFDGCKREYFEFTRRDGLKIQGHISLPVDYQTGARVPGVFWTYPREYTSFKDYQRSTIRSQNRNRFPRFSTRNASDIWLSQGYAVVVPDIPIIGKGDTYNDNYIAHLVDSMYAAIRKVDEMGYVDVDRLGHGGHSYGAFATANILAHSPFFKAGIAGDGAYNRTLTPMTFQRERRFIWEAQDIYIEMSPFFQADHIDSPLLMYHGAQDNNTGTFLIQSERMIQALTGLGKNAVLYIYPFESHGPQCKETYMDMWTRWLEFFDTYVKH